MNPVSPPVDLIKAIRTGQLSKVIAALDAGAHVETSDGHGEPGLPLAIACFMGHAEIVRELALRGARVDFADNMEPNSPLAMAVRGGKTEVVKVLIELGAQLPPRLKTGLTDQELMLAQWKAAHFSGNQAAAPGAEPVFEEIQVLSCYGTDTGVLDAEMRRAVEDSVKAGKKK
ncbi:MAG: ankyrin repeat domain-containing protein [Propionivibrio sp.]